MSNHHAPWLRLIAAQEAQDATVIQLFNAELTPERIETFAPVLDDLQDRIESAQREIEEMYNG